MRLFLSSGKDARSFILESPESTRRYRLSALRQYYRWRGGPDPTATLHVPKPRPEPKPPFTEEEMRRMLDACQHPQERALLLVFRNAGARLSEIARMKVEDVSEDGRVLIHGKGRRRRWVHIGAEAMEALAEYRNAAAPSEHLWVYVMLTVPRPYLGRPMRSPAMWYRIKQIAKRAGVQNAHPHRFRTTYAHRFLDFGGDLGALQVSMGHQQLEQTAHYAQWGAAERALRIQRALAG